jgi:nucleotide-binding universal stress UspA family protein
MVPREPTSDRLAGQDVVILHPTDFSAASEEALYIARDLAQACGARLLILFVLPRGFEEEIQFFARFGPPHCALASLSKKVNGTAPGFPVEVRISEGDAAAEIVRFAGEIECGLVVMGTHGRRGIGRLPKGGVAEQVLRIIDRPVLVVKPARSGPVLEIGRSKAAARSETRMAISTPGQARIRRRP